MELSKNTLRVTLLLFLLCVFFCDVLCGGCKNDELVVVYKHGAVKGKWKTTYGGKKVRAFLGLPYVKPPLRRLRFKDPDRNVEPWEGIRDATKDAPDCLQRLQRKDQGSPLLGNEDCLYLNVYTPEKVSTQNLLPILFFIHGGYMTSGSANSENFGPDILLDHNIILVALNYRLGVMGFLTSEDKEAKGNFGFKDQVAGLAWVNENIHFFGGDPKRITIAGTSTGACSVSYHLLSPMSKGLFQKGIMFSGAYDLYRPPPPGFQRKNTQRLATYLGCATSCTHHMMNCLRERSAEEIFSQLHKFKIWRNEPVSIFRPTIETDSGLNDAFITKECLKSRSTLPLMLGYASEDGLASTADMIGDHEIYSQLNEHFNDAVPALLRYDQYPERDLLTAAVKKFFLNGSDVNEENFLDYTHMCGDILYWRSILTALRQHDASAHLYYYTHRGALSHTDYVPHNKTITGVAHGDELLLVFPARETFGEHGIAEIDKQVSEKLVSLIAGFVQYGEDFSRKTDGIIWDKLKLDSMNYLHIETDEFVMKQNMLGERTTFWKNWLDNQTGSHDEL